MDVEQILSQPYERSDAGGDQPDWTRLGKLLALKRTPAGEYYISNPRRAELLYEIARRHGGGQPLLEVGTGRGYGAVALAMGSPRSRVWTIDTIGHEEPQSWLLDEGDGPHETRLSVQAAFARWVEPGVAARIRPTEGKSTVALRRLLRMRKVFSVIFIDAGHDYLSVKMDYMLCCRLLRQDGIIVLDDVGERPHYGVSRVVQQAVRRGARVTIVNTHADISRPPSDQVDHRMALVKPVHGAGAWQDRLFAASFVVVDGIRGVLRGVRASLRP